MRHPALLLAACSVVALTFLTGCPEPAKQTMMNLPPRYKAQPPRVVPDWLKGSVFEQVDLAATEPYRVSNFGLVVMKKPTGDAKNVPNSVREFMLREMNKRGFGDANYVGMGGLSPETVLKDPRVAIVRVDALIPAGASKGQRVDVQVTAMENSDTSSLAGGNLYNTDLYRDGANTTNPGSGIDLMGNAWGYVFVNPAYALDGAGDDPVRRRSLTSGTIMAGGRLTKPRPIVLNIRSAERRMSRMTEQRIDQLFDDSNTAAAMDEGTVAVNVPERFRGDWEHFAGVVLHTYWIDNDSFAASKALDLVNEAQKPNALLLDISYAWESLGKPALSAIQPLYSSPRPEIAFAAARAGAFIGDGSAELALAGMARDPNNSFRMNAVKTLVALQASPAVNAQLRELVKLSDTSVRIEAYRGLARNRDESIQSWDIGGNSFKDGILLNGKFKLDLVQNDGPPLVYASRSGVPRIAFIGGGTRLPTPTFFTAMNNELTISAVESRNDLLSIFYRGAAISDPIKMLTRPDAADLVSRLGGGPASQDPSHERQLDFTYGEIVAILSRLSDQHMLLAANGSQPSTFVLQETPDVARDLDAAPIIPDGQRPITDAATPTIPEDRPASDTPRPVSDAGR